MRGLAHACFFGLLIAVVSWYGRTETRDLLVRSVDRVYTATRLKNVVEFTHDYLIVPGFRFFETGEVATEERVREGTDAAVVVSKRGVRATVASMFNSFTSSLVRAVETMLGREQPRTGQEPVGTNGTRHSGAGPAHAPDGSPDR